MIFLQLSVVVPKMVKKKKKKKLSRKQSFTVVPETVCLYNCCPLKKKLKSLFTLQSRIPYCLVHIGIHSFAAHVCPQAFKTVANC